MPSRQSGLKLLKSLLLLAFALPCFGQMPGPRITSISPSSVLMGGPTFTLTVNGLLGPGFVVYLDNTALRTTFVSNSQLTAEVPASLTADVYTASIHVAYSPGVAESNVVNMAITAPPPILTSLSPATLPAATGQAKGFDVYGSGLISKSVINFNGAPVATYLGLSSDSLHASLPPELTATPGIAQITVTNPGQPPSNGLELRLSPQISFTSMSPTSALAGGTDFTLTATGTHFSSGARVIWAGVPLATSFMSDSVLTAVVPASAITTAKELPVWVESGGLTTTSLSFAIIGVTPVIDRVDPTGFTVYSATARLTAYGSNFLSSAKLTWAGTPLTGTLSGTSDRYTYSTIYADIPDSLRSAVGAYTVTVTNPGGVNSNPVTVMINPRLSSAIPPAATAGGPDLSVRILGAGYLDGLTVELAKGGATSALSTTIVNDQELQAAVPAALLAQPGGATLRVLHSSGAASAAFQFPVLGPPSISKLTPAEVYAGSSFNLTIDGANLYQGCKVNWNGTPLTTWLANASSLGATVPSTLVAPGTATISVFCYGVASNSLTFQVRPKPPVVYSYPAYRTAGSPGSQVTITGADFAPGIVALWENTPLAVVYKSAGEIQVSFPASCWALAGRYMLTLRNSENSEVKLVETVKPVLTALSPNSVTPGASDQAVTLSGIGFSQRVEVYFNSTRLSFTYQDSTTLTAIFPASVLAKAGTADVFVQVDTITSDSLPFYISGGPPAITSLSPSSIEISRTLTRTFIVYGSGFNQGSVVRFNGTALPTTFNAESNLTASISPSLLAAGPGTTSIQVVTAEGVLSNTVTLTILQIAPSLSSISPSQAAPGVPVVIAVSGSDFVQGIRIFCNNTELQTDFRSSNLVNATVPADMIMGTGAFTIDAANPGNPARSNSLSLTVAGPPVLTSLSPNTAVAGTYQFTFDINGYGFGSQSVVKLDGDPISALSGSSTKIRAYVARIRDTTGTAAVTVTNGTYTSNALALTITPQPPQISSFFPTAVPLGSSGFTLVIRGKYFTSSTVVSIEGTPLSAVFVGSTEINAQVPASVLTAGGFREVEVTNPDGASSTSSFLVDSILKTVSPTYLPLSWDLKTLTLTGTGFTQEYCPIRLYDDVQGFPSYRVLDTTYVNPTTVTAIYRPEDFTRRRFSLLSCGATSSLSLPIGLGRITSLSPSQVEEGSAGFQLTLTGSDFGLFDSVYWNGVKLETVMAGSTTAKANVPSSLLAAPGTAMVSIGGTYKSDEVSFSITAKSSAPLPVIEALGATNVDAAGPAFSLAVTGSGFLQGATVNWAGAPLATTFESATRLTATVPPSLIALAGSFAVTVSNPDGILSNPKVLAVRPVLISIAPPSTVIGGPGMTLTADGAGFTTATTLSFQGCNGSFDLAGTLVSSSRITGVIPAAALASKCDAQIFAKLPAADGTAITSLSLPFTIRDGATLLSIAPQTAEEGAAAFTLAVNGSGYVAESAVRWNGTPLATTFVSSSQLTAAVPAALVASAGNAEITVAGPLDTTNAIVFTVTAKAAPTTTPAGIVDAAGYTRSAAPGGLISIFGSGLAQEEAAASETPLPQTLKGVVVKINGTPAPLLYVSPAQINAQVPFGTPVGTATLVVESGGRASQPVQFQVTAAAPGVFTLPGGNHAIAQNHPDYSLNSSDNPALPGGYVVLYVAGLGSTDHPVEDGAPPPYGVLCRALADVKVKIGGKDAEVLYAGLTPGFIGLAQINLKIPDIPAGEQLVEITVGGMTANGTVLSIGTTRQ